MKKRTAWILFGTFWALLLLVGWTREHASTSTEATTQAIERLIRTTRRGTDDREPFILEDGPADPKQTQLIDQDLENAILLMQDKDYVGAIPLLERALKAQPTFEAIWEALGWCYHNAGRTADTDKLWQQYVTLRPDSPKAHSLLAQLAILRSDWRSVDLHLTESLRLEPNDFDIRYWYAQNLFRLGRLEASVALFETLIQEDPMRFDVKIDLARMYPLLQHYEESLELWTEIIDEIPGNLDFRTEYARALMLVGELEGADEEARRVLAEDPTRWPVMNLRADIAEISQRPEVMVESLRALIAEAEDREVRAQLRIRLGSRLITFHRKDAARWPLTLAMEQYEAAIDEIPTYVPWQNQYAQIAVMAKQPVRARRAVDRILKEFNPLNHQALRTLFEIEMLNKNFDAAERALDQLYESYQPDNPYRNLELARLDVQRGRYSSAMDALDRLEEAGADGAVFTLLYHGLTESEWMAMTSTRRLYEHLVALRNAGYTFIAPSEVPEYLEKRQRRRERSAPKPWLARQIDNLHYAFTGDRREPVAEDVRPERVAVVTFDDGLRSSFHLGTPIAQELGIPFWMAIITHLEELNAPIYASWEEVRAAHESGAWEIGSHLMYANTDRPAGPEPEPKVFNLVNRIWLPERNRQETLREWSARVRRDFTQSRALVEKHLGLEPGAPMAVAYPYGEIGQEEGSNVAGLINPIRAVLNESSRQYQAGFVVDPFGYTTPGDNLLMMRRYEPGWDTDAEAVVEHAMANHPVMMARRMRAEIATLMDQPYLAERQIELLRRDGYPDRLLRELIDFTQNRLPTAVASSLDGAESSAVSRLRVRPANLYVAGAYRENQSNEEILQRMGEFRAGLNLNQILGLEVAYRVGTIDQQVTSNYWFTIKVNDTTTSSESRRDTVNGVTTVSSGTITTTTSREVTTNRIEKYDYDADVEEIRAAVTLRINDHATLTGTIGQKTLSLKSGFRQAASEEEEVVGSLGLSWRPYRALQMVAYYDHDLVPSARRKVAYDAFALNALWKVNDNWDLGGNARYWSYKDKNAMVHLLGNSFWQVFPRQGIWAGLEASIHTMDEKSEFYWSPYWDKRFSGILRLRRAYQDYFFQFDVRLGLQSEKARPEDENLYRNLKARAEDDGNWYPGPDPEADWDTYVGLGGTYRQRLWRHLDLIGNLSVNFLRDYSEHDFTLGLQYNF
jgi:tetratricopeptide (TPR) repeat protein